MYRETSVILNAQRRSNEEDMLYMDIYPSIINSKNFLATMAHEYQHLLQFSYRYREQLSQEYTWLDEGISEVSSDISGYGPQTSRLKYGDNSLSSREILFSHGIQWFKIILMPICYCVTSQMSMATSSSLTYLGTH